MHDPAGKGPIPAGRPADVRAFPLRAQRHLGPVVPHRNALHYGVRQPPALLGLQHLLDRGRAPVPHPADHPRPVSMIVWALVAARAPRPPLVVPVRVADELPYGLRGRLGHPLRFDVQLSHLTSPFFVPDGTCTVWYIQPCPHRKPGSACSPPPSAMPSTPGSLT